MKAITTITNQTDVTVYTVPTGKRATVYVDVYPLTLPTNLTIKINDFVYFNESVSSDLSAKLVLDSGDTIKVSSTGTVNVFVHGFEF